MSCLKRDEWTNFYYRASGVPGVNSIQRQEWLLGKARQVENLLRRDYAGAGVLIAQPHVWGDLTVNFAAKATDDKQCYPTLLFDNRIRQHWAEVTGGSSALTPKSSWRPPEPPPFNLATAFKWLFGMPYDMVKSFWMRQFQLSDQAAAMLTAATFGAVAYWFIRPLIPRVVIHKRAPARSRAPKSSRPKTPATVREAAEYLKTLKLDKPVTRAKRVYQPGMSVEETVKAALQAAGR
jgi:hypothetical protein